MRSDELGSSEPIRHGAEAPHFTLARMALDPDRSTPFGFWRYARDYLWAARAVKSARGEKLLFPLLYLYGLAIELALKAFLLKRGVTLVELKRLSHGLVGLLEVARKRKLGREVKLSRAQLNVIRALDVTYSSNQLRYIVTGVTVVPSLSDLAEVAERLVGGTEMLCTGHRGHV